MCNTHTFTEPRTSYDVWLIDTDFDPFVDDDFGDEDELDDFDCMMGPGGLCGAAGSEWCEFECPTNRAASMRARIAAGKAIFL